MPGTVTEVVVGVDTHTATHHAMMLDLHGRRIDDREFTACPRGYAAMLDWMRPYTVIDVGIEGTSAYGAGLTRHLHHAGLSVLEVPRPDRRLRRQHGKSDPIDAEAAARTVLAGKASGPAKIADGPVEALRALRIARNSAVKARTAAINALRAMVVTAPEPLRSQLQDLPKGALVNACVRLRPDHDDPANPLTGTKIALRALGRRAAALNTEARGLKRELAHLTAAFAPATSSIFALGPETTAALLVLIGDNPDRLRTEAAFAHLCGVAPIPASSGKTNRHRLHRGGDRTGNAALHTAVIVRLRYDPHTRAYADRRRSEGKSMPEIIRCPKRYLAREVFTALRGDYHALTT